MAVTFAHIETNMEYVVQRQKDNRIVDALSYGKKTRDMVYHKPSDDNGVVECQFLGKQRCTVYYVPASIGAVNAMSSGQIYMALEKQLAGLSENEFED